MTHATGWLADPPAGNATDPVLGAPLGAGDVPHSASVAHLLPPTILDQGGDNSCVAQAVVQLLWSGQVRAGIVPDELASRKLLWWLCRRELGTERFNTGCYLRGAFELAQRGGFARERHFSHLKRYDERPRPYLATLSYDQRDTGEVVKEVNRLLAGIAYRLPVEYRRIVAPHGSERIAAFKAAIASGLAIAAGVDVPERLKRHTGNGVFVPESGEPMAGGHAMVIHGYGPSGFQIRNSWGRDWGDGGNAWVDEAWVGTWRDPWVCVRAPAFSDGVA